MLTARLVQQDFCGFAPSIEQAVLTCRFPQFSAFVQFIGIFLLRETYGPILLLREAHRLKRSMGLPADSDRVQTIHESKAGRKSVRQIVAHGMLRPFSLFISEQIIMLFAAYMSVIYGTIYILLTTTSSIYEGVYGQNVAIASLHYIALMLGFMAASQGGARGLDVIYRRLKAKRGGQGKPEYRLPLGASATEDAIFL